MLAQQGDRGEDYSPLGLYTIEGAAEVLGQLAHEADQEQYYYPLAVFVVKPNEPLKLLDPADDFNFDEEGQIMMGVGGAVPGRELLDYLRDLAGVGSR